MSLARWQVLRALGRMRRGRLRLVLPSGEALALGGSDEGPPAELRVAREAFFRRCLLYGDLGFAESYLDGDWETPDLAAVLGWLVLNREEAPSVSGSRQAGRLNLLGALNRLGHLARPGTRAGAARNVAAHYDLSNAFFALWLDPSLTYSSARWTEPGLTLEQAQHAKNALLFRKLELGPDDHLLEIGTGWGGLAVQAAKERGCRVTTVTLSQAQAELAEARVRQAGLAGRVQVRRCDFREVGGRFDKLVSVEMVEALGHRYLPVFAAAVGRLVRPGGRAALQLITCPEARYPELRRGVDFTQKHIFPGSLLVPLGRLTGLLERAGLGLLHREEFAPDYARTLGAWHARFAERLPEVRALGFDERFCRKWRYYLAYCQAAFAAGHISVAQALYQQAGPG